VRSCACSQDATESTHLLQAIEFGPLKGKGRDGPCILYLKNLACEYSEFVHWFAQSEWLLRSATRLYLFPPEAPSYCAPTMQELADKIIARGKVQCKLRLQVAPRKNEIPLGVRYFVAPCLSACLPVAPLSERTLEPAAIDLLPVQRCCCLQLLEVLVNTSVFSLALESVKVVHQVPKMA
jgi:hypothetical protein